MNKNNDSIKELSTTNLAKELKISTRDMFQELVENGLIVKTNSGWELTPAGKSKGGIYKKSERIGRYIVWPSSIRAELDENREDEQSGLVTATSIGKRFNMSAKRVNSMKRKRVPFYISDHRIAGGLLWEFKDSHGSALFG